MRGFRFPTPLPQLRHCAPGRFPLVIGVALSVLVLTSCETAKPMKVAQSKTATTVESTRPISPPAQEARPSTQVANPGSQHSSVAVSVAVPEALIATASDWYGLYIQDTKVGFLHRQRGPVQTASGESTIELREDFEIHALVLGGERSTKISEYQQFLAQPPHLLHSATSETIQGDDRRLIRVVRTQDGYDAEICEADGCRSHAPGIDRYTLSDALAAEIWIRSHPQEGTSIGTDSLLLGDLKRSRDQVTLSAYRSTFLDGLQVDYAEIQFEDQASGISGTMRMTPEGRLLAGTLAGAFDIQLESEQAARTLEDTTDLFLAQAVRVDQPLGELEEITAMTLALEFQEGVVLPSSQYQSWSCTDQACQLRLGATTSAGAEDPDSPGSQTRDSQSKDGDSRDSEIQEALEATVSLPTQIPAIRDLAKRAVSADLSQRQQVEELVHFVSDYIEDSYFAEPLSVTDLIDDPRGDCTEHSMLFITLARSLGIPAREVTGLLYTGDLSQSFGGHAWAEVFVDHAWLEVDPTWDEIPPNAGHIRLGHRLGDTVALQAALAGATLRLVEVERR